MDIALSLMVFACLALFAGAFALWRRQGYRRQAVLMAVLAVVIAANVAIWSLPTPEGQTLAGQAQKKQAPE